MRMPILSMSVASLRRGLYRAFVALAAMCASIAVGPASSAQAAVPTISNAEFAEVAEIYLELYVIPERAEATAINRARCKTTKRRYVYRCRIVAAPYDEVIWRGTGTVALRGRTPPVYKFRLSGTIRGCQPGTPRVPCVRIPFLWRGLVRPSPHPSHPTTAPRLRGSRSCRRMLADFGALGASQIHVRRITCGQAKRILQRTRAGQFTPTGWRCRTVGVLWEGYTLRCIKRRSAMQFNVGV